MMQKRSLACSATGLLTLAFLNQPCLAQNMHFRLSQHPGCTFKSGAISQSRALTGTFNDCLRLMIVDGQCLADGVTFKIRGTVHDHLFLRTSIEWTTATRDGCLGIGNFVREISLLTGCVQGRKSMNFCLVERTLAMIAVDLRFMSLRSWYFKALLGVIVLSVIWALYLFRIRRETSKIWAKLYERFSERERIARDLHDTFFQGIQGLMLSVQSASRRLPEGDPTRLVLEETLRQSDSVMSQGRELVFNLRVRSRVAHDLGDELESAAMEFSQHYPKEFRLVVLGEPKPLKTHVCEELCRLGREALCIAYRHARARLIEVKIEYRADALRLAVSDDGTGLSVDSVVLGGIKSHPGLTGMKERAQSIGATFKIVTSSLSGTIVQVDLSSRLAYPSAVERTIQRTMSLLTRSRQQP
jgi:signal transduction histidine kinase